MQSIIGLIKKIYGKFFKSSRTKRILITALILLLAAFLVTRGAADQKKIKTAQVEQKNIASEIVASGKITSLNETTIHPAVNGKVVWVPVKEEDYVKKDQAIASLDKEEYEIAQRQAQQDIIAADAELERLYDDLKKQSGAENYDNRVRRTAAEATKNKAVDALKKADRDLKDTVLTSPFAGTVIELNVHPGEEIFYTTAVAKIADIQNINFTSELDDTDIGGIKEGQKAIVTLDAFPEEELDSQVESISFVSNITASGADVFEVKFNLEQSEDYRIGMNGEARIITQERNGVLVVPIEALTDEKYVWTKTDGSFEKKEVAKGIESDSEIEIISGLTKDETVATAGFDQIGKKSLVQKIFSLFNK